MGKKILLTDADKHKQTKEMLDKANIVLAYKQKLADKSRDELINLIVILDEQNLEMHTKYNKLKGKG